MGDEKTIERESEIVSSVHGLPAWEKLNAIFDISTTELYKYRLRIDYMLNNEICTSILVNFKDEQIYIVNYTEHPLKRAFGVVENPTWDDFNYFLEDRCVPRTRDHMKVILNDYGLDYYDPLSIIEKTGGRMAEDDFYLKLYCLACDHDGK